MHLQLSLSSVHSRSSQHAEIWNLPTDTHKFKSSHIKWIMNEYLLGFKGKVWHFGKQLVCFYAMFSCLYFEYEATARRQISLHKDWKQFTLVLFKGSKIHLTAALNLTNYHKGRKQIKITIRQSIICPNVSRLEKVGQQSVEAPQSCCSRLRNSWAHCNDNFSLKKLCQGNSWGNRQLLINSTQLN